MNLITSIINANLKKILFILLLTAMVAVLTFWWARPDLNEDCSGSVSLKNGDIFFVSKNRDGRIRLPTKIDDVDPLFLNMLIASEDKRFYSHFGVDPIALARALISDLKAGRIVSGGSTLAMQAVRSLDRRPRTLLQKIKESIGALYLTCVYGRKTVLEIWLTRAPFGADTEGVKAASLRWFGHDPSHLTPEEAALLVALPRSPERIRPDRHPQNAARHIRDVLRLAKARGVLSNFTAQAVDSDRIPHKLLTIPSNERGLSLKLLDSSQEQMITTLDGRIQNLLKVQGKLFKQNHHHNVTAAAVVIDRSKHEIAGYLGAAVPEDSQLPLAHAVRSPGSALKPFAYAIAFEQHLLHPKTILSDEKTFFGNWAPRNFSGEFSGNITAETALAYSLNLPALEVMKNIDPASFASRFGELGLVLPQNADPSLSLILGGCGISLVDLTALYAALEDDGLWYKNLFKANEKKLYSRRILSKGASRAVSEILKKVPAPAGFTKELDISYKTGTSWGSRDAWAVGSYGQYTAGVWCGRPDGKPAYGITGFEDAAPLLFRILQNLNAVAQKKPELSPQELLPKLPPKALLSLEKHVFDDPLALKIEFPQDGSVLVPGNFGDIDVFVKGGVPPLYLFVNNKSCPDPDSFNVSEFIDNSKEYQEISVIDSSGRGCSIKVKILQPD